jgi:cell volume regulation protein A
MASFVFGLVLGNHALIGKRLRFKTRFVVDERIRQFHGELSFMIRTFFFVFLGLVFSLNFVGRWSVSTGLPGLAALNNTFPLLLAGVVLLFVGMLGVRIATARLVSIFHRKPPAERRVLWSVMGRGLGAAVLAALPFTIPAFVSPATPGDVYYRTLMAPYETLFLNIVFLVIFLTVATTTIGVFVSERALGRLTGPQVPSARVRREFEGLLVSELEDFIDEESPGPAKLNDPGDFLE